MKNRDEETIQFSILTYRISISIRWSDRKYSIHVNNELIIANK